MAEEKPINSEKRSSCNVIRLRRGNPTESIVGDYRIVPINSTYALSAEGCKIYLNTPDYDADCAKGLVQALSVRGQNNVRLATLVLTFKNSRWEADQILGIYGEDVSSTTIRLRNEDGTYEESEEPSDLYYLTQEIARILNSGD